MCEHLTIYYIIDRMNQLDYSKTRDVLDICLRQKRPLNYISFQVVFHRWCNKGRGIYYRVCGTVYMKELLLLIGKSSYCGDSRFSLASFVVHYCMTNAMLQ